jgi:hypothetical protein
LLQNKNWKRYRIRVLEQGVATRRHYSEALLRLRSCSKIETIVSVVFGQKRSARESGLVQDCQSKTELKNDT